MRLPRGGPENLSADVRQSEKAATEGSGFSEDEGASLTGLAAAPKIVFSSTLQAPLTWPYSELVTGDAVEMVDSKTFDGRLQLLEYVPTVLSGPPGSGSQ